nr:MAG TPA: hypothetical protein [Caudoviricetes sp.]
MNTSRIIKKTDFSKTLKKPVLQHGLFPHI